MAKDKKDQWGNGKFKKNEQYERTKKDDTDVPRKPNKKKEEKKKRKRREQWTSTGRQGSF